MRMELSAGTYTCAAVRARASFPTLIRASLRQATDQGSGLILSRFWDTLLGTPPQSEGDGQALGAALGHLLGAQSRQ